MPTLVLSPRDTANSRILKSAAERAGWVVEQLSSWRAPHHLYGQDIALYGEPLFAEVIASRLSLALIEAPNDWLVHLPMHYRKRHIEVATLARARTMSQPTFVKPADGRKSIEAKVYQSGTELPSVDLFPDTTQVFLVEPVIWEIEFRCFIREREIMTMSPYLREGELVETAEGTWEASSMEYEQARSFVEKLLADQQVSLPPALVIDVGNIRGKGWAVIEANAAWGAGIYGCNPAGILPVLARACIRRDHLTEEDAVWTLSALELEDE
jgi:hypothetical protein